MKAATNNKNAGWIKQPEGIVAVEICRLTGALPTEGCRRVAVTAPDGSSTEKNYVGAEYFRRGTEPQDYCTVHESMSIGERFRHFFGVIGR